MSLHTPGSWGFGQTGPLDDMREGCGDSTSDVGRETICQYRALAGGSWGEGSTTWGSQIKPFKGCSRDLIEMELDLRLDLRLGPRLGLYSDAGTDERERVA